MRALSAEGVLALRPDLILAVEGSGPPGVMDILRSASVPLVVVPDGRTVDGMDRKIRTVAEALGVEAAGRVLAEKVHAGMAAVVDRTAAIPDRKSVLFVPRLTACRPMGAGPDTATPPLPTKSHP